MFCTLPLGLIFGRHIMSGLIELIRWNIWPRQDSLKGIARAIFYGVVGNLVLAALAGIFLAAAPDVVERVGWPLLSACGAIHLLLAWFTCRGSRVASLAAVAMLLGEIAYAAIAGDLVHPRENVEEAAFPFIGLLLLANGVRGAFALRRLRDRTIATA